MSSRGNSAGSQMQDSVTVIAGIIQGESSKFMVVYTKLFMDWPWASALRGKATGLSRFLYPPPSKVEVFLDI